jgi:HEAT repeat protein
MAKTIEPRFLLWQDYGFRKLISDSISTAGYMLTKLGTNDARETQVMRVLSQRMQKPVANALITKLNAYLADKSAMSQPEVSFACYIFGETKDPAGKDILLRLTDDENYKIRSSAVNALGKIKYDEGDIEFKNRVSERLRTLAGEQSEKKLYRKDIAFAFNNYKVPENIPVLMNMLKDKYYGARFTVSDNLRQYGDDYMNFINDLSIYMVSDDYSWMNPFLYSLLDLSDENFKTVYNMFTKELANTDGLMKENLLDIIRLRRGKSSEPGFLDWCDTQIEELQRDVKQKIR